MKKMFKLMAVLLVLALALMACAPAAPVEEAPVEEEVMEEEAPAEEVMEEEAGNPNDCWMHMQGSFVTGFFSDDIRADLDNQLGVFIMPGIDETLPFALEVGGDQYVVFDGKARPEVKKFMEFLATGASADPWITVGGSLFPHQDQDTSLYPTMIETNMAEAILTAEAARFDGSDGMDQAVNNAFWKGITDWVSGATIDEALAAIDENLPEVAAGEAAGGAVAASTEVLEDTGTVFVMGAFRGEEENAFTNVIAVFEEQNPDIDVIYAGSAEFEALLPIRVEAGDPPDIAALPQPGTMKSFAADGLLEPLWPELVTLYDTNYTAAWKELGSYEGTPYGLFHRVNAKGWVWYNKPRFEAAGYTAPATWDEFEALMADMATTDTAPLCVGIESGAATGWYGTDWVENLLLRTSPVDVYDQWVNHTLPFSSPEVKAAWEIMDDVWFQKGYAYGGPPTVGTTNFKDAALGLFIAE